MKYHVISICGQYMTYIKRFPSVSHYTGKFLLFYEHLYYDNKSNVEAHLNSLAFKRDITENNFGMRKIHSDGIYIYFTGTSIILIRYQ